MENSPMNQDQNITQIETIFYEQFSKNQSANNDFLVRVLLVIGSVIAAYGYTLIGIGSQPVEEKYVFLLLLVAQCLLSVYFKIIYDEAYAFRRDQVVVYRILKKHRLVVENLQNNSDLSKPFYFNYNPLKHFYLENRKLRKKRKYYHFWMPAFHNTLSTAIIILQFLLYCSFLVRSVNAKLSLSVIFLVILTLLASVIIVRRKHKWLSRIYLQELLLESEEEQAS